VLDMILEECDSPHEVRLAVESLPPGLEATYTRCLARKRASRPLCNIDLLIWVCAATKPLSIDALQELLAMDPETGRVSPDKIPVARSLLQSGVGLVTLGVAEGCVLPVHSTARNFVFSGAGRLRFHSMLSATPSKKSWTLCIEAAHWTNATFRSALGSLCLVCIKQETFREVVRSSQPIKMRVPQPEIPKLLRRLVPSWGVSRAAEMSINPSLSKYKPQQASVEKFLQYAIENWLHCNKIFAPEGVLFPWLAQGTQKVEPYASMRLFEQVARERNDSFGIHPWPSVSGSPTSHLSNMFAYAVANDHVPLMEAVKRYRESIPTEVFDRPFPIHGHMLAIHFATKSGFTNIVGELITLCDLNKICHSTGKNVLHFAAELGDRDCFQALLQTNKVDVNLEDNGGRVPLHCAAIGGHASVVKLLLETDRVEVNWKDNRGRTVLHRAVEEGQEAVVKLLLKTDRVEVNWKDDRGRTALHRAVEEGQEAVVKLLLMTYRVEVNPRDYWCRTPLHRAAETGNEAVMKLLLSTAMVEMNLKDNTGRIPLHRAAEQGNEETTRLLLETDRVEADLKDDDDRTPLHYAAELGYEAVVKLLLEKHGIEVGSKDIRGWTPLQLAFEKGHGTVVSLLIARDRVRVNPEHLIGQNSLREATGGRHETIVQQLLTTDETGVDEYHSSYRVW